MSANLLYKINTALQEGRDLVLATIIRDKGSVPRRTGAKMIVYSDGSTVGSVGGGIFESLVVRDALVALKSVRNETRTYSFNPSGTDSYSFGAVCGGQVEVFLEVFKVPDKLIIVGAGHCGRALAQIASHLDLSITIIDDRIEYLRPEEFELPNVKSTLHLSSDFTGFPIIDSQTYIVLVSRGFDTDQAALRHVLKSPARYIGMIGSRRKRKLIFSNLKDEGFSDEELNRVHSPVGLEIGAETPEEIAISILAEIIKIRSNNRQITNNDEE